MDIILHPQVRDATVEVYKYKDTLIINGEEFDFSPISNGDNLPSHAIDSEYFLGNVTRVDGSVILHLFLPITIDAPVEKCFPTPLLNIQDGHVFTEGANNEHRLV